MSRVPFLYQFEFFTHSHFFTSSLTSPSLQNLFPRLAFLRTRKRCKSEGAEYGLSGSWGRTVRLSFVTAPCVFRLVCSLHCRVEMAFSNISVLSNTNEQLLHGLSVSAGILTSVIIYLNVDYAREVVWCDRCAQTFPIEVAEHIFRR
jgi:hypothetical protein